MRTLHVGIRVADRERSLAFYGALGYEVVGEVPETGIGHLTMLKLPGDEFVTVELVAPGEDFRRGDNLSHLVVQVESMDDAVRTLAAAGIEARELGSPDGTAGFLTAKLEDPDGNTIELVQWPPGHADGISAADWDAAGVTVTPVFVADLLTENGRMPVYVHVIDHPDARVLVDTGMTELHPLVDDMDPRLEPLTEHDLDLESIDIVVNTHLHYDHCGGNHLFAGKPIYVQRRELDEARGGGYTIPEWVDAPGVEYVTVEGEHELLPGLRLVPAPGHSDGLQVVVIETAGRPIVVGGDVATHHGELDAPESEGQRSVRALDPELVWLAHEREPWRP